MRPSAVSEIKFVITGGPTREWIDPVRFISNPSTGKMGAALARAASGVSENVVFIHGPVERAVCEDLPCRVIGVDTTAQMHDAVMDELDDTTVLVMAAAPADWAPAVREDRKIKKSDHALTLELVPTVDILKAVARFREGDAAGRRLFIAGFAAETHDIEQYAAAKLAEKKLDMICVNDVSRKDAGFAADTNQIVVLTRSGERLEIPFMEKSRAAEAVISIIAERIDF